MGRRGRTEQGDQTAVAVLDAATALFSAQGYAATSISAISKAADVRPASIYWAFGSKEGLLAAVITRSSEAWLAEHGPVAMAASHDDVWEGFRVLSRLMAEQPEFLRLMLVCSLERRDGDPAVLGAARQLRAAVAAWAASVIEAEVPIDDPTERRAVADELGWLLLVLLDGSFVARQIDPDGPGPDRSASSLVDALRGALAQRMAALAEIVG